MTASPGRGRRRPAAAGLRVRVRVLAQSTVAIGPGKADLLIAIDATGSIAAAARTMGMSYRRAWLLVDTMNACFRSPLVQTSKGGLDGGGALLTTMGQRVLSEYQALADAAGKAFVPLLRRTPSHHQKT